MAACATSSRGQYTMSDSNDSLRVKMKEGSRSRKQQWVETLTPPRSPSESSTEEELPDSAEPIIDDLWELWTGAGLDELDSSEAECTLDNALSTLGFTDGYAEDEPDVKPFKQPRLELQEQQQTIEHFEFEDILFKTENEIPCYGDADIADKLLDTLFQFVDTDSPPPTNPPSPPGPGDSETESTSCYDPTHTTYVNYTSSTSTSTGSGSISSSSSIIGDEEELPTTQYEDALLGEDVSESSPLYDEGYIGEDLMSDQPSIFDSNFNFLDPKFNIFDEEFGKDLKHDCMWNGGCCSDSSSLGLTIKTENSLLSSSNQSIGLLSTSPKLDDLKFDFPKTKIKVEPGLGVKDEPMIRGSNAQDDDELNEWSDPFSMFAVDTHTSSGGCPSESNSSECFNQLSSWSTMKAPVSEDRNLIKRLTSSDNINREELEQRRLATLNDHSYANPNMPDTRFIKPENPPKKGIQAIVLPEENGDDYSGGPKKTKILVPLKDLMDSLQHKTFLVAPLGPGKKVIRLTGSETVKGMLGVHHQALTSSALRSVSSYCVPQQSLYNRSSSVTSSASSQFSSTNPPSKHSKKSKMAKSILREGGTITFPNQFSPLSPSSSCSSSSSHYSSSNSSHSSSSSSASNGLTPSGKPKKTKTHNNMERMRRIDLRNSFDSLKKLVPPLSKSAKCSKVEILKRADEYIRALKSLEKRLVREETAARARNDQLKSKLLHLQQNS